MEFSTQLSRTTFSFWLLCIAVENLAIGKVAASDRRQLKQDTKLVSLASISINTKQPASSIKNDWGTSEILLSV